MVKVLLFYFSLVVISQATVDIEVEPKESSGNPVTLRFTLRNEGEPEISTLPRDLPDWNILGPQQAKSSQFTYSNGQTTQDSSTTITFLLYPKKVGQLKVPLIQIKVNGQAYSSPQISIRVLDRSSSPQALKKGKSPSFPIFPLDEEEEQSPQFNAPPGTNSKGLRHLEVVVVAEPSKVEVYAGELILLPFYIYTNENIFRNLEFAAFPTFKDFLKEELYLPRSFKQERVKYRGADFYRAEVVRFALFPLKEGELLVDPLKMRFEIDTDLFQLFQQMLRDQSENPEKSSQTFLRSSGSLPIIVKALPPKPLTVTQEEIPVGKYTIQMIPPTSEIVQNEAFSLKIKVTGQGNIKGIPEPELKIPAAFQKSKTETDYTFNTLAEGYKDFDLLLVPRRSGTLTIPENKWTYFDPNKKTYETLTLAALEFKVSPSNRRAETLSATKDKTILYSGEQNFEKFSDPAVPLWIWIFPSLLYVFAGFLFVQRRKFEKEETLLLAQPWLLVERKIYAQKDLSSSEALGLVEEWILKRFQVLHIQEAAFDDLTETLRKKASPGAEGKIDKLRERFKQIEFARFGGGKRHTLNLSFAEIKKLSEEIIHSSSVVAPPLLDDDDEDS